MTHPLTTYLESLQEIRRSQAGLPEPASYPVLRNFFNDLGKTLTPKILCIVSLKDRGAGLPDGGLFTQDQIQADTRGDPIPNLVPSRGAIEIKAADQDVRQVADSEQVGRYLGRYGQVLVTNYWDFLLVGRNADGQPTALESYRLAESEAAFWATSPRKIAQAHGKPFTDYVTRVMRHAAPLTSPQDVAEFLAAYAREALARIEKSDFPALGTTRAALEEALGITFEGKKGEHFFRSTLIQTLFYGVFSAWVLWSKRHTPTETVRFDWQKAAYELRVPVLRKLFHELADPGQLEELNLSETLDWAGAALNRVDRTAFFTTFEQGWAVQYFYEPFLHHYDPDLRKDLGVWYTPPEVVRYMVARVDTVLREELAIEDGLADPRVYVLDPCCGTGTYLLEVLRRIADTLAGKGDDALVGQDLKRAARERVFGFEILPAPFVVSHLQLGLFLQQAEAPLAASERVGVYLTNALTGWEPPKGAKKNLTFREMEDERDAAEGIKREKPILVILGNPPYNAFAGVSPSEELALVDVYKEGLNQPINEGGWGIKKFNLDDLYVRFFRLAERRIVEGVPGKGVVCFVSNFSYLSDPSFVIMRHRLLEEFDSLWLDCLNGDSRETGKLTPDGNPDPSVFSTEHNREGIRLGTTIGLLIRKGATRATPSVRYRDFWGATKRADLLNSLEIKDFGTQYTAVLPTNANRYSFRPSKVSTAYAGWPKVVEFCANDPISGLQEMRQGALIDFSSEALEKRMRDYFNPRIDWDHFKAMGGGLVAERGSFKAKACREKLQKVASYDVRQIRRYSLYPFDNRWCYYSNMPSLWNRPRPALVAQAWRGNMFFITRMMAERPHERAVMTVTSALPDYHALRPNAVAIPIRLRALPVARKTDGRTEDLYADQIGEVRANLSSQVRDYLNQVGISAPDTDQTSAALIWMHSLAVGYSPTYLAENADGVRQDWPRIPLPASREALMASASLGEQVAALLDTERQVKGVISGMVRPELRVIATLSRLDGKRLDPCAGDLKVSAGWGHVGKDGVIMPGQGRIVGRPYSTVEVAALQDAAQVLKLIDGKVIQHLGDTTNDVYLNDIACWKNVPKRVWEYTVGGYQVMKKWLSYREHGLLGRSLTTDEVREVTNMARRIAALLLLEPQLDANYHTVKQATLALPAKITKVSGV